MGGIIVSTVNQRYEVSRVGFPVSDGEIPYQKHPFSCQFSVKSRDQEIAPTGI